MPEFARLRKDLISAPAEVDGQTVYNIKDPITGSYFRVREPEFWLINRLDGQTSPENIAAQFKEKFSLEIGAEQVGQFIEALSKLFFLEDNRSEQEISRAAKRVFRERSLISRLLYLRIKAFNRSFWFMIQSLIILLGAFVFIENANEFVQIGLYGPFGLGSVAAIIVSLFIIIIFHEFAHAVICRYYGGEVTEMGFLLLFFQPCFYCNVSDAWLFPKKSQRIAVTLAGPLFQLFLLLQPLLLLLFLLLLV